jgi:RimJ/RimL family protein N-acetyltransferase
VEGVRIVPAAEEHIDGYHRCVGVVARERRYIGFVEPPPLESTRDFVRALIAGGGVALVAVDAARRVVGWCDVQRFRRDGFRHCGRLGMGLLPEARGRGIGRALAFAAVEAARAQGIERVELEVFASNTRAIALYDGLGFVREGVKRHARKLDGQYDDNVLMAILLPAAPPPAT